MVKHTEEFMNKHRELLKRREIAKQLKEQERLMKKQAAFERFLKRTAEQIEKNKTSKEYKEYQSKYREKTKIKKEEQRIQNLNDSLKDKNYKPYNGYFVTDQGEIINRYGRVLRGCRQKSGYITYQLNGSAVYGHRLVWEVFLGEIPSGLELDHINADRGDNRLSNLRTLTHRQNCNNPESIKNYKRGNTTGHCVPIIQVFEDGTVKEWFSATEASRNGYTQSSIWLCCNGRMHKHKNCKWYYKRDYDKEQFESA